MGDLGWEDALEKGKATHSSILDMVCIVLGVQNKNEQKIQRLLMLIFK